ncbi:Ti-type conjugative transfer relaxase TraA [Pseudorhizobium banfieldiae]|nr:Ti-type conjugative transfer relaxase TraA [arsenite-oxidising bacterium NT-25]
MAKPKQGARPPLAIYHASMKPVPRSSGRSAVAAAAYRSGDRLTNERDGRTHDFLRKQGIAHAEIVLPEGVSEDWALDRSKLWNAAEAAESRKDARVAREFEIALPHELDAEQRLELARDFAGELANRYGAAVDVAIHEPHGETDIRNHHAHLLMTTRTVGAGGLGEKTHIERKNEWLLSNGLPTSHMQLRDIRQTWELCANRHLERAGLDVRIDHRSHSERGLEIAPTEHMGVHATQVQRRGGDVSRGRLDKESAERNAELIRERPEQVLAVISREKSVFDRHDIARALHRYLDGDAQTFQNAFSSVMASKALVELEPAGEGTLARYSTREMVEVEGRMAEAAVQMADEKSYRVEPRHVERAMAGQDAAIRSSVANVTAEKVEVGELDRAEADRMIGAARLSDEQRAAIAHVTGAERIAAVVGFAGAGKSTMLAAAREAWERQGYRVHGAALAGKATEGLEESSGIQSRTLASWEYSWRADRGKLGRGDVLVIDEAGMIDSRQLARFILEAQRTGAKIVLVGDHEQLQAIGAGAAFRAVIEQIGAAELTDIRRQREDWQRAASVALATNRTAEGFAAYAERGHVRILETKDEARAFIVGDYMADRAAHPDGTRVALAHRRADVRALNGDIRSLLQGTGELARGEDAGEVTFQTNDGKRAFAPGDRIVFLENDRDLGVKNGMLGTVERVEADKPDASPRLVAVLDGKERAVSVPVDRYRAFDHGYATTIHKSQGATVDRAFVMASSTMDRHMTYVAMTRHREGVQLYGSQDEFAARPGAGSMANAGARAGMLIAHGKAPYENQPGNRESYFVAVQTASGQKNTVWGADLERAMREAAPAIGTQIGFEHKGAETVRLPDGRTAERNSWSVLNVQDLALKQMESRLSRSGAKETTLDYAAAFAERRGLAERMGVRSEIEIPRNVQARTEDPGRKEPAQDLGAHTLTPGNGGARGELRQGENAGEQERGQPAPLVPAITDHARSIEDVAREKATPAFEHHWQSIERLAKEVYTDPGAVTDRMRSAITHEGRDETSLSKTLARQPEQFGELRGKSGLFGANAERKNALKRAEAMSSHLDGAGKTWTRRFAEEKEAEQWRRDRNDRVQIPGLTPRSETLLKQLDQIKDAKARTSFVDQLEKAADGKQAIDEAKCIAKAMQSRFGSSDHRDIDKGLDRTRSQLPEIAKDVDRIKEVARITNRARETVIRRDYALERAQQQKLDMQRGRTRDRGLER